MSIPPHPCLPLYSDFRFLKKKDDLEDPRPSCPHGVLKATHQPWYDGEERGSNRYGHAGYRNPTYHLPLPVEGRDTDLNQWAQSFSVGERN